MIAAYNGTTSWIGESVELAESSAEASRAAARAAVERFGRLDILCANAGIYPQARIEDMTEEQWDRVLGVNLKSVLWGVKASLPHMKAQGGGRIVVTSSITGPRTAIPGLS